MIGRGLNGSAIKHVLGTSAITLSTAGSTDPVDLSEFSQGLGTLLAIGGSVNGSTWDVHVMRSGTSNGTFQSFGCSAQVPNGSLYVRSWVIETSAPWHRLYYTGNGRGAAVFTAQGARNVPIDQNSTTLTLSDVDA